MHSRPFLSKRNLKNNCSAQHHSSVWIVLAAYHPLVSRELRAALQYRQVDHQLASGPHPRKQHQQNLPLKPQPASWHEENLLVLKSMLFCGIFFMSSFTGYKLVVWCIGRDDFTASVLYLLLNLPIFICYLLFYPVTVSEFSVRLVLIRKEFYV